MHFSQLFALAPVAVSGLVKAASGTPTNAFTIVTNSASFSPPPAGATVLIPQPSINYTNHQPCTHTFNQLWKLQVALWDAFLWPNNFNQTTATNSTLFATNVKGRVDVTRTFDGRELNTEYIFGMFAVRALNPNVPSILGYPVSYTITHFVANQDITASATVFNFYMPLLGTSVPVEIDTWLTWNKQGQVTQYDATFRWFDYAIDSLIISYQGYLRTLPGYQNASVADTQAWFASSSIKTICDTHEAYCHGSNQQYANKSACTSFLTNNIRFGKGYELGMNTILCRTIHENMVPFRPSVHCPHIGPTGGGYCVDDQSYVYKVLQPYFSNEPFVPYGYEGAGHWNETTNKDELDSGQPLKNEH